MASYGKSKRLPVGKMGPSAEAEDGTQDSSLKPEGQAQSWLPVWLLDLGSPSTSSRAVHSAFWAKLAGKEWAPHGVRNRSPGLQAQVVIRAKAQKSPSALVHWNRTKLLKQVLVGSRVFYHNIQNAEENWKSLVIPSREKKTKLSVRNYK